MIFGLNIRKIFFSRLSFKTGAVENRRRSFGAMAVKRGSNLGGFCDGGTPVPFPNTEVKPISADGSRKARVGRRQDLILFLYKILYLKNYRCR